MVVSTKKSGDSPRCSGDSLGDDEGDVVCSGAPLGSVQLEQCHPRHDDTDPDHRPDHRPNHV